MTREEFITRYCGRSGVDADAFMVNHVALPCNCGEECCEGWAMLPDDPALIAIHDELYAPERRG